MFKRKYRETKHLIRKQYARELFEAITEYEHKYPNIRLDSTIIYSIEMRILERDKYGI